MIATIATVLGGFAWLVVRSYRQSAARPFQPEGKLRWTGETLESD